MYFVYVLRSLKDNKLYIGITGNVEKRLQRHNAGRNKSTKPRRPFILLMTKQFSDKHKAYQYEWQIKNNGKLNKSLKDELAEVAQVVTAPV